MKEEKNDIKTDQGQKTPDEELRRRSEELRARNSVEKNKDL